MEPKKRFQGMDTTGFKVVKLPPNGPRQGQSTEAWLYGKEQDQKRFEDRRPSFKNKSA